MAISPCAPIDESKPYPSYQRVEMCPILATRPQYIPPPMSGDEEDIGQAEPSGSVFHIPSTPAGKSRKNEFGDAPKGHAWGIATNFSENSAMLISLRRSGTPSERIVILSIVAAMRQCKSADGARSSVKRVACLLCFPGETVRRTGCPYRRNVRGSSSS